MVLSLIVSIIMGIFNTGRVSKVYLTLYEYNNQNKGSGLKII